MRPDDEHSLQEAARYARMAARVLTPPRRADDMPTPGEREASLAALTNALATRPARVVRRRLLLGLGATAIAAAAAIVFVVPRLLSPGAGSPVTARLDRGPLLAAGTVVQADAERPVSLSLSTGTQLRLSKGGRVRLAELGPRQHFVLDGGTLWAKVSPLARDHRFLIGTPDAEIEVRGTAFEVVVAPDGTRCESGMTQVKVSEGLVTVRRGQQVWQVAAGQSWPAPCSPPEPRSQASDAAPSAPATASLAAADVATNSRSRPSRIKRVVARERPATGPSASSLREQNNLFAAAMEARRRGDVVAARRTLDDLLTRFPFGALAESARGELATLRRLPPTGVADPAP